MFDPFIVFAFSLIGVAGAQPYVVRVTSLVSRSVNKKRILVASVAQGVIFMAISSFLGAYYANMIGASSGIIYPPSFSLLLGILGLAVIPGFLIGGLIILFDRTLFLKARELIPSFMEFRKSELILSALYGGISEEILARFFVFSAVYYYASLAKVPFAVSLSLSILVSSLIFAVGHLPNVIAFAGRSRLAIIRTVVLNMIAGIVFGLIFFYFGLVYSIVSHFTADMIVNYPYRSMRATSKTQIH